MPIENNVQEKAIGNNFRRAILVRAGEGLVLGISLALVGATFDLDQLTRLGDAFLPLCAVCGAIAAVTRARPLFWWFNGMFMLALVVVGYTPLVPGLMRGLERSDRLSAAPAVVVLADFVLGDGTLGSGAEDRILHGYEILRKHEASTLVLTHPQTPGQSWSQKVRGEMRDLGLDFPIVEVGPVNNTHDEALCVAELMRQRGWSRIILVTHAWHMRRAAATFEKAGVNVICAPCPERAYDLAHLDTVEDRVTAFNQWLHEAIGYRVYRWRGWI